MPDGTSKVHIAFGTGNTQGFVTVDAGHPYGLMDFVVRPLLQAPDGIAATVVVLGSPDPQATTTRDPCWGIDSFILRGCWLLLPLLLAPIV